MLTLTPEAAAIIVAMISLIGVLYVANSDRGKLDKKDAVQLESRLATLEAGQLSEENRKTLYKLSARVGILWRFFEKGLPDSLKSLETVRYDALLNVAMLGFQHIRDNLSAEEQKELISLVQEDLDGALAREDGERMLRAGLYLAMLETELP